MRITISSAGSRKMGNEKKSGSVRNIMICLFAVLFLALNGLTVSFLVKGWLMYSDAVSEMSIGERIENIRSSEDFTRFSELSDFYIAAVISVEDHRFEKHCGIDIIAVCRAVWTDMKAMSWVEGGSTITQQLAKNMIFTQEKKLERKIAECFAALAIENEYSKSEIFELYVNTAYFGSGYYGIHDAAEGYFGKLPSELTDYESAMLAGLPNAPSAYSPDTNMELAVQRTSQVLRSMVDNRILTQEEAEDIMQGELM